MADSNEKWGQQLDKIAYAVAGVAGLIVLAVPFLFSGQIKDAESDAEIKDLRERIAGQPQRLAEKRAQIPQPDSLREAVAKQWAVGEAGKSDPAWVSERPPLVVKRIPKKVADTAKHEPGKVLEIACERDAEKKVPYLVIKGAPGEGNLVVFKKASLLREEGDGQFVPVKEFEEANPPAKLGKAFEFKDYAVVQGKSYTYQLLTLAERDPGVPGEVGALAATEAEKKSEPLGPVVVPHDFKIEISAIEPAKEDSAPRIFAKLSYWDYQAGKAVDWKGGSPDYFVERQKFANDRFDIFRIDDLERKVTIRELESNLKHDLTQQESRLPRSVKCEEPLSPESLRAREEEEKAQKDARADAAAAAASKKTKGKAVIDPKKKSKKDKGKEKTGKAGATSSKSKPAAEKGKETGKKKQFE